ncbi:MAG TPA: hypothetical protein PLS81_09610 [Deltaproteobacteria bacterium]|nr:hypothetical protein [Deltaproteobacteria bacterium]HOM29698.1 hypothetical protein [Deltaproteobacteria bacterium]HPP80892.1 hypothetical protein [Deltaproteobacteria bacterium]
MKGSILVLGTLITLILFTTAVFAGNPSKATQADAKKDTLIVESPDAHGQDMESGKGANPKPDGADWEKKDKGKTVTGTGSQDSKKGKDAQERPKTQQGDDKKTDKVKDAKDKDVAGKPGHDMARKETVVGYVMTIDNLTGLIVVKEENKKTERAIVVNARDLASLSAGAKVNIELAPGTNTAEKISVIAEGKGGAKSKRKK